MTYPLSGIRIVPPGGQTLVTSFTALGGATPTVYVDPFGVTPISLPDTITTSKIYYMPSDGPWTISAKLNGSELAGVSLILEDNQIATVSATLPLLFVSLGGSGLNTAGGVVQTLTAANVARNVLDDGSGNMSIASGATLTVTGSGGQIVVKNTGGSLAGSIGRDAATGGLGLVCNAGGVSLQPTQGFKVLLGQFVSSSDTRPPQITGGTSITSSSGAPGIAGVLGDLYFRTDTPSTSNQRIYICTTAGGAGAAVWTGIL